MTNRIQHSEPMEELLLCHHHRTVGTPRAAASEEDDGASRSRLPSLCTCQEAAVTNEPDAVSSHNH